MECRFLVGSASVLLLPALLKDAGFDNDEATSALDNESEKYIQAVLQEVMLGRRLGHRSSSVNR